MKRFSLIRMSTQKLRIIFGCTVLCIVAAGFISIRITDNYYAEQIRKNEAEYRKYQQKADSLYKARIANTRSIYKR